MFSNYCLSLGKKYIWHNCQTLALKINQFLHIIFCCMLFKIMVPFIYGGYRFGPTPLPIGRNKMLLIKLEIKSLLLSIHVTIPVLGIFFLAFQLPLSPQNLSQPHPTSSTLTQPHPTKPTPVSQSHLTSPNITQTMQLNNMVTNGLLMKF